MSALEDERVAISAADGHAVIDDLIAGIDERLSRLPQGGLHVEDLLEKAQRALGGDVAGLDATVHSVVAAYDLVARAQGYGTSAMNYARSQLSKLLRFADETFTDFDQAEELAQAETELTSLEKHNAALVAELQVAVEAGDVDEVMRIRPQLEIALPRRREEARVAVLELQVARAEAAAAWSTGRRDRATAATAAAQKAHDRAREALQRAEEKLTAAHIAAAATAAVAGQMDSQIAELATARDQAASAAALARKERAARLAGMAAPEAVSV